MSAVDSSDTASGASREAPLTPTADEVHKFRQEGCLLWAKIKGYSYWPGIVTVDPMDGLTVVGYDKAVTQKKGTHCKVHVHFLGYDNMRAWVPDSSVMLYEGKAAYDAIASKCPKSKVKDYFPTKKYQRLFDKGVQVAEDVLQMPLEARLKKLGLIYVLIDESKSEDEDSSKKSLKRSAPQGTPKGKSKKVKVDKKSNGHAPVVAKIVSTGGFFKSFNSTPPPPKQEKASLDVFEFDDSEDGLPPLCIDIKKVDEPAKKEPVEKEPVKKEPVKKEPVTTTLPPPPPSRKPPNSDEVQKKRKPTNAAATKKPAAAAVKANKKQTNGAARQKKASVKEELNHDVELLDETPEDPKNPLLGSLVWGRMSGFPFWPCFITKSPNGDYMRTYGKRKEYHAQFFNWNNESGWITSTLPWCPVNDYHSQAEAACPKGPNTPEGRNWYPPARLAARWKGAVFEAQKTAKMSRKERYAKHVVHYSADDFESDDGDDSKVLTAAAKKQMPEVAANAKPRNKPGPKSKRKQHCIEDEPEMEPLTTEDEEEDVDEWGEKPCPASKKAKLLSNGVSVSKVELPRGWTFEVTQAKSVQFNSPEGITYQGVGEAISRLMQQNCGPATRKRSYSTSSLFREDEADRFGWFLRCTDKMHFDMTPYSADQVGLLEGPVEYLKDESLPASWSVRTIRSKSLDDKVDEVLYQSSAKRDLQFTDKVSVARFLEGMGHPALEIEQLLHNFSAIARVAPKDLRVYSKEEPRSDVRYTIVLSDHSVEEVGKIPLLAKTVVPCYLDMVKLPDIFLKHPHVKVRECNNEMTIRDSITDEFIAKKIIYD